MVINHPAYRTLPAEGLRYMMVPGSVGREQHVVRIIHEDDGTATGGRYQIGDVRRRVWEGDLVAVVQAVNLPEQGEEQ